MRKIETYRIRAVKCTGRVIEGTCEWDGCASLYIVRTPHGVVFVTVMDEIKVLEKVG